LQLLRHFTAQNCGGKRIYDHGPHELWKSTGWPQNILIFFYDEKYNKVHRDYSWLV